MITQDMSSRIDKILEKKSNPADIKFKKTTESSYDCDQTKRFDMDESAMFPKPTLDKWNSVVPKKIEPQVVDDKIEYEIIDSFPLGIEKFEDFGKNKAIYFYDPDYYTRVINEKAKHISYESADNYLKSK